MTTPLQQAFRFAKAPKRHNIVIEAGAGTGKTTAIVAEVLKLLLGDAELLPERLVLMTFTEKAAGEIAERIHQALADLEAQFESEAPSVAWPSTSDNPLFIVPDDQRGRYRETCRKQLARIDGLRSQTIHSFCQSLLRTFPIEAGLDPQFRIIDGYERSLLYSQLYDKWADHETRVANDSHILAEWEALIAHTGYLFRVRDFVFSLSARRDLIDDQSYTYGSIDEIEKHVIDAVAELKRAPSSDVGDDSARKLIDYLRGSDLPAASIDAWIAYFSRVASEIRNFNLNKTKAPASVKNALKALRVSGEKGDSVYDALVSHRAAAALLALTRRFVAFLDREKHALGVVDFDDLLLRTAALLEDAQIAERVRQQFDAMFVDEFQDTDRTQARIIERLSTDRSGSFVDGRTLIVGDPKQSIYGFRRADPETYQRFSNALIAAGADPRRLDRQYRSDPELVDAFNDTFAKVFANSTSDANVFRPAYHHLAPGLGPRSSILGKPFSFLLAPDAPNRNVSEAETIAEWILARADELSRYAILFRRLTKLEHYLDTFDRYGIDYVLPPTRMFLDRRAPVDLLAVLRAIAYPFDVGAEISAARTPYFALTDQEIAEAVIAGNDAWRTYRAILGDHRDPAEHHGVSETIDRLIASSGIEAVYEKSADHGRSLRHLEHVRAIAFAYDQTTAGSLRQFVAEIDRRREEPDEMEPNLADDETKAVRILSVHAAKGLEFDNVILPDLSFPRGSDMVHAFTTEEPRSLVLTGQAETLSARFRFTNAGAPLRDVGKERDEAELRRLFYVAVTRARHEVVFVCNPAQKKEGFFATICGTWDLPTIPFEEVERSGTRGLARKKLLDAELERQLVSGELLPPNLQSPSPRDRREKVPEGRMRGRATAKRAGILLHRVLELWNGIDDVESVIRAAATECAADERAINSIRNRIATLRASSAFHRIIRGETIAREMTIRFIDENAMHVERRVDRLLRENGREVVVDYKSGAPDAERLQRDREQVARYCRAIEQITGRGCSGLLWYIDTDSDKLIEVQPVESSSNAAV